MIEVLESRIAPSGLLSVSFAKGSVTIKSIADSSVDGAETITLTETTPGELVITPGAGTQLKLGADAATEDPITVSGFTGKLTIAMGGGDDSVTISSIVVLGALSIDQGDGSNATAFNGGFIQGDVILKGGKGADAVQFGTAATAIGGNFTATLGEGVGTAQNTGVLVTVGKNFSITTGASADDIQFDSGSFTIGGNATFSSGAGADKLGFGTGVGVVGNVSIAKNATLTAKGGTGISIDARLYLGGNLTIGGKTTFTLGNGTTNLILLGANGALDASGPVSLSSGAGTNTYFSISGGTSIHFAKKLTATSKADNSTLNPALNSSVGSFDGGITANVTNLFISSSSTAAVQFNGAITVKPAAGKSLNVFIPIGDGADVTFNGPVTFAAKPKAGGYGTADLIGGTYLGPVKFTGGDSADSFYAFGDIVFAGALTVDLGKGDDNVQIAASSSPGNVSRFLGPVSIRTGAGADTIALGGDTTDKSVIFYQSVTVDGGPDTDTLTQGTQATFVVPLKQIAIP